MSEKKLFKNSFGFKRYYTQDYYLKNRFGKKMFKVSLNAGFTCPNRDGTKGVGGCSYCSEKGSGDFAGDVLESIPQQFEKVRDKLHQKWNNAGYIAYFQAFTNTYGTVDKIRNMLETALSFENVEGVCISTRPDCIDDEIADLLLEFSKKTWLEVELGLQTIHEQTSKRINRCHTLTEFEQGYFNIKNRGIDTCIHIINGLPYEDKQMMLQTAQYVAKLKPESIKIHMLHLIEDTQITREWREDGFKILSLAEYVDIVCDQIELMPQDTVIQRVTGDGDKNTVVAPIWTLKKFVVINNIDKELIRRNSFQGKNFNQQEYKDY